MSLPTLLHRFGLSAKEASTYLAILQLGRSTIKPIGEKAKVKRTSIYNFINHLVELGLVTRVTIRGRSYYEAVAPERLIDLEKERLRQLQDALPELQSLYNRSGPKPRISYFEGPEEVKNIVREEPRCKREALYIWPGKQVMEMIGGGEFMTEIDNARIAKGVQIKTIRFRNKDVPYATSAHGEKFLRELRFAPPSVDIAMGLGIYDSGKVGFFSSTRESFGILIESQELMQMMRTLYSLLWERAIPARAGEG